MKEFIDCQKVYDVDSRMKKSLEESGCPHATDVDPDCFSGTTLIRWLPYLHKVAYSFMLFDRPMVRVEAIPVRHWRVALYLLRSR